MLTALMFSVVAINEGLFLISHIQLLSRYAGGSIARQLSQAGQQKYFIPWASCSVYEWGWLGEGGYRLFLCFESFLVWEIELFPGVQSFSGIL